jgi:DNA end-binding protein Ku
VLETLRYADEVHKAQNYFREISDAKPDDDLLDLAETLIEKKTAPFDASQFHDRYIDALHELIERKRQGKIVQAADEPAPSRGSNVVDLMAALKRSIERPGAAGGAEEAPAKKAAAAKAPAKKPAARRAPRKEPARKRA